MTEEINSGYEEWFFQADYDFENKDVFQRSKMTMEAELKTLRKFMIPLDIFNMTLEEYRKVVANKRFQTHVL